MKLQTIESGLYKSVLKRFLFVLAGLWLPLAPITSQAYVPEVPQLVDLMTKALSGPKRLQVVEQVSEYMDLLQGAEQARMPEGLSAAIKGIQEDSAGTDTVKGLQAPSIWTETLSFVFPYRFRRDAWVSGVNLVDVINGQSRLRVKSGIIQPWQEGPQDAWLVPLLYRGRLLLLEKLARWGVDLSTSSLGRWEGGLVYVIGDDFPQRKAVQLWIDKKNFLPTRWILPVSGQGLAENQQPEVFEIRYLEWTRQEKVWYPGRIEFYRGKRLLRSCQVLEILTGADFSDILFDLGYLKEKYSMPKPEPRAVTRDQDLDEVQQAIDSFHNKFKD